MLLYCSSLSKALLNEVFFYIKKKICKFADFLKITYENTLALIAQI